MFIIDRILTWWRGQTLNTQVWTALHGEKVGEDQQGNIFYQTKNGKRRWVIFNGESDASRVSPDWHGWLHHTFKEPPTKEPLKHQAWQKPYQPNMTGTPAAYYPAGSLHQTTAAPRRDYDAWQPE